jgi:hypothetical protein
MALLSKNKPTKRIDFEGGFVVLQHLSKGVKDEIQSRLASLYKDLEKVNIEKLKESNDIPEDFNMDVLRKVNEVQYYKLSKAIKVWSESDLAITEEAVQELDEVIFQKISTEIDEMNTLNNTERKN